MPQILNGLAFCPSPGRPARFGKQPIAGGRGGMALGVVGDSALHSRPGQRKAGRDTSGRAGSGQAGSAVLQSAKGAAIVARELDTPQRGRAERRSFEVSQAIACVIVVNRLGSVACVVTYASLRAWHAAAADCGSSSNCLRRSAMAQSSMCARQHASFWPRYARRVAGRRMAQVNLATA